MRSILRFNKYNISLIGLICCNITGQYGGALTLPRIIAVLSLFYIIKKISTIHLSASVKLFFLVWILISIISLVWSPDKVNGMKFLFYNCCNVILFLLLIILYTKTQFKTDIILNGWCLLFLFTVPIALYEFSTGSHLSVSVTDEALITNDLGQKELRTNASVTFGNLNTYVVICIYCLPFILGSLLYSTKKKLAVTALIFEIIIVFVNASRGGVLCLVLSLIIFLIYAFRDGMIKKWIIVCSVLLSVIIFLKYASILFAQLAGRMVQQTLTEDTSRFDIYTNCLKVLYDYMFLGCGIGGVETALTTISSSDIAAPHNMWLEFLCQYGVATFIFFVIFICQFIRKLYQKGSLNRFLALEFILLAIPLFIINSGYLAQPLFWIFIASYYCLSLSHKNYYSSAIVK